MLKRGALAVSAAVFMSIHGLVGPAVARAADVDATSPGGKVTDDEVIIEAHKTTPQSINPKATHTQDVITSQQLSEIPVTSDFIQALQYLPNVDVYEQGGNGLNGSQITINGFDTKRLNFTLDGIPLNDSDGYAFYSNEFAQNMDIASISVSPSAGTATTIGLTAFGGSVDIDTKNPSAEHAATLQGGAGSFATFQEYVKLDSGEFFKDFAPTSAYISYNHARSGGYFDNSATDYKNSILFKSATQIGSGTLTLFTTLNEQLYHLYGGCQASSKYNTFSSSVTAKPPFVPDGTTVFYPTEATVGNTCNSFTSDPNSGEYTGYSYNKFKTSLSYAGYNLDIGDVKIDNKVFFYYDPGYQSYAAVGSSKYEPAQYVGEIISQQSTAVTNKTGDVLRVIAPLTSALTLQFGTIYSHSNTRHSEPTVAPPTFAPIPGDSSYDESVITQTSEPYVNLTITPVTGLIIDAGVRYLIMDRDFYNNFKPGTDLPSSYREALPSIGMNYEFASGYHVYANFTQNGRAPDYSNLYSSYLNQDLAFEKANTFEGGILARSGGLEGRLSAFHTKYSNYISTIEVQPPDRPTPVSEVINAGDAEYYGASLALTYQFQEWLSGFLNAGWLHTNVDYFDQPANNAPKSTASAGFEVHSGGFAGSLAAHYRSSRLDWGNDYYSSGGQPINAITFYELPSLTTLDAHLSYKWEKFEPSTFKTVEAKLIFTNITNQQKPIYAGTNSYLGVYDFSSPMLYLSEPFSVFATVAVSF